MASTNEYFIELHRGVKANRPTTGHTAEPYFCTDTNELFIWNPTTSVWAPISGGASGSTVTSFQTGTYITLATDTFSRANENPVNPAVWSGGEGGIDPSEESHCQVLNNALCPTQPDPFDCSATYTGISWPNNQWAQFQVLALNSDGSQDSAIILAMRSNSWYGGLTGYQGSHINFEIDGPLGAACNVEIYAHLNSQVQQVFLGSGGNNDTTIPLYSGDYIRMELWGNYLFAYTIHDGVVTTLCNGIYMQPGSQLAGGNVSIQLYENAGGAATDAQIANFSGGLIVSQSALSNQFVSAQQAAALAIALG